MPSMARSLWPLLALAAACSSSATPAHPDLAGVADPCYTGTVPVSYFIDHGICAATYAAALASCRDRAECGGLHVVGDPGPYVLHDCFYDATSGTLVGGYTFSDIGPSCTAGSMHTACPAPSYSPCDADAGP